MENATSADLLMEYYLEDRPYHSVLQILIDSMGNENTPERSMIDQFYQTAKSTFSLFSSLDALRIQCYMYLGVLEYAAISKGTPERESASIIYAGIKAAISATSPVQLADIFFSVFYKLDAACKKSSFQRPIHSKIHNCMEYIENNTTKNFSLVEMAEVIGYSPAYLSAHFHEATGMTITQYRNQCRLKEAAYMLRNTQRSLSDISRYLRFSDQSHFQRSFKKSYGMTPNQYRKMQDKL